jgi:hypothetical protein
MRHLVTIAPIESAVAGGRTPDLLRGPELCCTDPRAPKASSGGADFAFYLGSRM